jgi:Fur family ferric uptake transcriptional regulator
VTRSSTGITRNTRQRIEVRALLADTDDFRSAQQLHTALRQDGSRVGLTTVYRTLQVLADAGEVDTMRLPSGETLYRRCSRTHHHHLVCRDCGATVEVEGPAVERWAGTVAAEHGYTDVSHTLESRGRCSNSPCSNPPCSNPPAGDEGHRPMTDLYVEAPTDYRGDLPAVFLAGGITGCPDWQAEARELLAGSGFVILNPRRGDFPIHDPDAAAGQIAWEFTHLRRADVVLFWFPDSGPAPQPIALYELGAHAATGKPLAVGADPGYRRRADVVLQLGHVRPGLVVRDNLADVCADAASLRPCAAPTPSRCCRRKQS